ncbi:MAG TPA: MMPL family transporter, partial [Cyclobacteriaceae bacterium]|nr:MMPL family transporter [Cyclobacteriaceae bacterium]
MWSRIAQFIINYRLPSIVVIGLITVFMGYHASKIELSREFARTVPPDDPDMVYFNQFKEYFGEDGNIVALGILDSSVYKLENFNKLQQFSLELSKLTGVNTVVSIPLIKTIQKDTANKKFFLQDLFPKPLASQEQLDSLMGIMRNQRFYMGQIVNEKNGATMVLVSLRKEIVNSAIREKLIQDIEVMGQNFSEDTHVELRYAGLPFIRTEMSLQVRKELRLFLFLSMIVTGVIMFLFFRSFRAVIFSMIVISVVVVWVLGTVVLFGYKITLLTGLIPPVIVTIGITNAIYLLNKYHLEYAKHLNKEAAIAVVVRKMGLATFLTNLTVAIGFLTLLSTDIMVLREFGIVAGINIMGLFLVSLLII